jgi:hypothetical protein
MVTWLSVERNRRSRAEILARSPIIGYHAAATFDLPQFRI